MGYLVLQDGEIYEGVFPSKGGLVSGEVVFTTGMTGYPESLTDPSFAGQILVFTYPLIGNYGINFNDLESEKIQVRGAIISETTENWSHSASLTSLAKWLEREGALLLAGVDTRKLVKRLRSGGSTLGMITDNVKVKENFYDPNAIDIVSTVTQKEIRSYGKGKKRIIAVDCGMKKSLLDSLLEFPCEILRVPADYDFSNENYDGVFISNGPGDPEKAKSTIENLKKAMKKGKPIFGVCLGCQLMAIAAGAKTEKLKFGHRGQNVPAIDVKSGRCYITSQNHGFAVKEETLPEDWEVLFRNLNDATVEGIMHRTKPFFAVQFHPEAAPGPTDTRFLFERFIQCL